MEITKILLDENELPKRWYNIQADLPTPLDPPLVSKLTHEGFDLAAYDDYLTGNMVDPEDPDEAIRQSISRLSKV